MSIWAAKRRSQFSCLLKIWIIQTRYFLKNIHPTLKPLKNCICPRKTNPRMSSASLLQMLRGSTIRCVCRPLIPAVTPTTTTTTRNLATGNRPKRKGVIYPKKKRLTRREEYMLRPPVNTRLSDVNIIESRKKYGGGNECRSVLWLNNFKWISIVI